MRMVRSDFIPYTSSGRPVPERTPAELRRKAELPEAAAVPEAADPEEGQRAAARSGARWSGWEAWRTGRSSGQQATDYRIYKLSPGEWLLYGAEGVAAAGAAAWIFYRSLGAFFLLALPAAAYPLLKKKELQRRRQQRLETEFREGILILASALNAGYSPENAMAEAAGELRMLAGGPSMILQEFDRILAAVRTNVPLEKAWEEFALRCGSEDIRNFAEVIRVAKRSDGDLTGIISHTADMISDKLRIKEEILTITSGKRFEQRIMNLIPAAIVLYIDLSSPGFFDPMYGSAAGRLIMTGCLAVYAAAWLLSGRILEVEI